MVKVIMAAQGSGKTRDLIASINESVKNENGSVVCLEKGNTLRYDINYRVRLIDTDDYSIASMPVLQGFISGLHAGNFDISHIFIDSLYKILGCDKDKAAEFCAWCEGFAAKNDLRFTITVSDDPSTANEGLKKYL